MPEPKLPQRNFYRGWQRFKVWWRFGCGLSPKFIISPRNYRQVRLQNLRSWFFRTTLSEFLLRKLAGAKFDTDLALDSTGEGALMLPIQNSGIFPDTLSSLEIEVVRQWVRYGAQEVYASTDPQPDYGTISAYYDSGQLIPFFHKPPAPPAGRGYV